MPWQQQISTSTSFNSLASTSFTLTLPGGIPPGGCLEVLSFCGDQQTTAVSAGGGAAFTAGPVYVNNPGCETYWRVTNGSEGATVVLTLQTATAGNACSVQRQVWSGQAASPLDTSGELGDSGAGGETSTPSLATGALAGPSELLLEFGWLWGTTGGPPTSPVWTDTGTTDSGKGPAQLASSNGDGFSVASYCGFSTNPPTAGVTVKVAWSSWTLTPSGDTASVFLAFKPAPPVQQPAPGLIPPGRQSPMVLGMLARPATQAPPAPPAVTVPQAPPPLLRGPAAAARGKLAGIQITPPRTGGPPAPFFPPRTLLRGALAAARGKLAGLRGRPGRPSPFTPPRTLTGPAAARPGHMMHGNAPQPVVLPSVPAPFFPPRTLRPPPALARPGRLTGTRGRPGVPSPFTAPAAPLHGQPAARRGVLAGIVAPPPVIQPNVPAPFFPPHSLLRGQAPARARTPLTRATAPPPAPPPPQTPHWQGATHMPSASATGNLILGANHTGTGGPGDPKGDYERSGD